MSRKILGLDIRREAVCAVVVRSGIKGSWIESHARVPITVQDGTFEDALKISLEDLFGQIDTVDAVSIVAMPADVVAYRNLSAPFKETKKVRQILPFELETDLPFQAEEIVFDFNMLKATTETNAPLLFVGAVEKRRVEAFVDLLKPYKLEPDILTIGGYATGQFLSHSSEEKGCQLFLDIGDSHTTMVLSLSGDICLVRAFTLAASDPVRAASICPQVNRTLLSFRQKTGLKCDVDDIRITGPAMQTTGVEKELASFFGAPVSRVDLLEASSKVSLSSKGEFWQPFLMDGALALVLNELSGFGAFNFRRGRAGMQKVWLENRKDLLKTGCLAGLVALLFLTYGIVDTYSLKQRVETKRSEIMRIFQTTFPEVTNIVDPVHQMRVKLEEVQKGMALPGEFTASVKTIDILNDISRLIPEKQDVELVSIVVGADNVVISGNTDTFNAVDDMKSGLEEAPNFKSVSISSANMDQSGTRVRFKLKVTL